MQVQATFSCILLACIAASLATDTDEGSRPKRDLALLKSIVSKLLHIKVPTLPPPIRDEEIVLLPPLFGERVVNLRNPIVDDPDCHRPIKFTRLRPPFSMVRLPPPPPFMLPIPSPMEFVPRSMQIYPPPPPLPAPPPGRVLPPPMPILPKPGCILPHPHPMPIPPPPKTIIPPPSMPILPPPKSIVPPPMSILPPRKTILPPPPMPVFPLPLPPIVTEPILPPMPIPLPRPVELPKPILIPSFKYLYNQRNGDGSVTTTYSKDGKDVLVTITDDKLRIPPAVIVDRVEKIVTGAPFLPVIPGPEPIRPLPIRDFPVPMRPIFRPEIISPRSLDLGEPWMASAIEITNKSIVSGEPSHYGSPRLPILSENVLSEYGKRIGDREDAVTVTTRKISRVPPPPAEVFGSPPFARLPGSPFYSYKQINSEMSEPVAVVNVEQPVPFGPGLPFAGDVSILNRHEHIRPDGTKYICFENHLPVRVNSVEPLAEFSGTNGFPFMQPMLPFEVRASHAIEKNMGDVKGSAKRQMNERGSLKFSDTSSSTEPLKTTESFKLLPLFPLPTSPENLSLSKNPIVVLPSDSENTFSYKVNKIDGSSLDVIADKDNKVSVKINNGNDSERRGDIPELLL